MKFNKVGVTSVLTAAVLLVLPSARVMAEQQKPSDVGDRSRENERVETSTINDENRSSTEESTTTGQSMSEEHRSKVATFVQNLLKSTDKNEGGIGEQVRQVAKDEDDSEATTTEAIKEIENRSSFKTFLIGTDYKNIGVIRSQVAKTEAHIDQLNRLIDTMPTSTIATSTAEQLSSLKQTEDKLKQFITDNENKFSLFGWFVRLFTK